MQYLVRAGSLAGFTELVTSQGGDPIDLMHQSNLLPSQLNDPDTLIPYEKLSNLLELAANRVGMPEFGARLSRQQGLSTMGVLGAYMVQQKDIGSALQSAQKFAYMHAQGVNVELLPINDKQSKLSLDIAINSRKQYPQLAQLSIGLAFSLIHEMMGRSWQPDIMTFTQLAPLSLQKKLSQIFACEVQCGALGDSILFKKEALIIKPVKPKDLINEIINKQFMHMHSNMPDNLALVQHAINMLLPTGDCNKENIALSLGMHPKKLERILREHNMSYRETLEKTRKSIAISALDTNHMSMTTLALNLGYSEFSAFSRSFKHWFGVSPKHYQKRKAP